MALITDDRDLRPVPAGAVGLLACVRPVGRGTELDVLADADADADTDTDTGPSGRPTASGTAGIITVGVSAAADEPAADLLLAGVRVIWQRIDLCGPAPACTVAAVGHRRPLRRPVRLGTALALAGRGVATIVIANREVR
ncbi:hypothetical protein BH20ACT2_BH20ACT2_04530 [soil metagenome]